MREAIAHSPSHVTGFFEICDSDPDPLKKGSRGAGISMELGVTTKVITHKASSNLFKIRINGSEADATVSRHVLNSFSKLAKMKFEAEVEHIVQVPIGSGFGSSGAGALSLAIALNKSLEANLPDLKVLQIAHIAEIECQTGLGTVIAEAIGGFEVRLSPGAPGFGEVRKIPLPEGWKVVCLNFSPISKKILKEPKFRKMTNEFGKVALEEFVHSPTPSRFMTISRDFSGNLRLIGEEVGKTLTDADRKGITCSMMMIGNSAFSLIKEKRVGELIEIFKKHSRSDNDIVVSDIDSIGGRLIQ